MKYAERVISSGDENVKTNAGIVIEICLSINKYLKRIFMRQEMKKKSE